MKFEEEEAVIEAAMDAIRTVRNIRAEAEAAPSKKVNAAILAEGAAAERLKKAEHHIKSQANVAEIKMCIRDRNIDAITCLLMG